MFFLRCDHAAEISVGPPLAGSWDIFLDVPDHEAESGVTAKAFARALHGDVPAGLDDPAGGLTIAVLQPLCWAGLLAMTPGTPRSNDIYRKTPLWRAVFDRQARQEPGTVAPFRRQH